MAPRAPRKNAPKRRLIRRKRMARRKPTVMVNRALSPIPQRYITRMKYSESFNTDSIGRYMFNMNSTFDPNRTGLGHQFYGRDTLASLYNRYRVISCSWRVTVSPTNSNLILASFPANEESTFSNMSALIENPRVKYVTQGAIGSPVRVLTGRCSLPSLVGRTKSQYMADDRYQAQENASPAELALLHIFTSSADGILVGANCLITLTIDVEWFDIKHLSQS